MIDQPECDFDRFERCYNSASQFMGAQALCDTCEPLIGINWDAKDFRWESIPYEEYVMISLMQA